MTAPVDWNAERDGDYSRMEFNLIGHWSDSCAFQNPLRLQDIEIR